MVSLLSKKGYYAVAPMLSPLFRMYPDFPGQRDATGLLKEPSSNWSERHSLYAAGMGTFGLHDGLITVKGTAVRCGTIVVNMKLPPTPRKYRSYTEYCPFFTDKSCGLCIDRCPAGTITAHGHNKIQCDNYGHGHLSHLRFWYRVETFGCGLCMTGVPCESQIPPAARKSA